MLRGESVVCGTSTTGTGTLTLAACPAPPGGADFYAAFTGQGSLGTAQPVPVSYTLIEYTDSTFATAKAIETGIGGLTLGANIGATTLARTSPQVTATGLNSTPTYNVGTISGGAYTAPTAITIGTAANCLVFIGAAALHLQGALPYTGANATTLSRDGAGVSVGQTTGAPAAFSVANQTIYYTPIHLPVAMLVSKIRARTSSSGTYTGQNNNVYGALYAVGSNGLPGKLLADFGGLGTANQAFQTGSAFIASAALATPILLMPGYYFAAAHPIWTAGGSGTPGLGALSTNQNLFCGQLCGHKSGQPVVGFTETSNATAAFADPAATPSTASVSTDNTLQMWIGL